MTDVPTLKFRLDIGTNHLICKVCGEEFADINDAIKHARVHLPEVFEKGEESQ